METIAAYKQPHRYDTENPCDGVLLGPRILSEEESPDCAIKKPSDEIP
jgi:hypothetical protein